MTSCVSLQPGCESEEAMFLLLESMFQQKTRRKPANQSQLFLQFPGLINIDWTPCNRIELPAVLWRCTFWSSATCKCALLVILKNIMHIMIVNIGEFVLVKTLWAGADDGYRYLHF